MLIYDAFIFFNEIELLKVRFELLFPYVHRFVVCEANTTFSGQPKSFNFLDNIKQFEPWLDKITFIKYEPDIRNMDFTQRKTPWLIERGQRNYLSQFLTEAKDEDILIVSDVDEIWHPDLIGWFNSNHDTVPMGKLRMLMHYFFMNCRGFGASNQYWQHAFFVKVGYLKTHSIELDDMRQATELTVVNNAGWHFSYLGGAESVIRKIESFSHQELNTDEIKNFDRISKCINRGLDPYNREDHQWAFIPIENYPDPLASIMRRNLSLIKTSLI